MGLDSEVRRYLQEICPGAFVHERPQYKPNNMPQRHRDYIDLSSFVFQKTPQQGTPVEFATPFCRMIFSLFKQRLPGIGMDIVLFSDGPNVTPVKGWLQQRRRALSRRHPLQFSADRPTIPDHPQGALEGNWPHLMSYSNHRAAAMKFLVDTLINGYKDTNLTPLVIPKDCSLIVMPMGPDRDSQVPMCYDSTGCTPLATLNIPMGEGDFFWLSFEIAMYRQVSKCLTSVNAASESAVAAADMDFELPAGDLDMMPDRLQEYEEQLESRRRRAESPAEPEPKPFVAITIHSIDSDLYLITTLAHDTLQALGLDVVIDMGYKTLAKSLTEGEYNALPPTEKRNVHIRDIRSASRPLRKEYSIKYRFRELVVVSELVKLLKARFPFGDSAWTLSLLILLDKSDLVPDKLLAGQGLKRVLDAVYDEAPVIVSAPKRVLDPVTGNFDREGVDQGAKYDIRYFQDLVATLCRRSMNSRDAAATSNGRGMKFHDLVDMYNRANAGRGYVIRTGREMELALKRGLYALNYYGIYGWNLDVQPPDPAHFGWCRNSEGGWQPEY